MSTHSSLRKRKLTGGKKRAYRSKKKYEAGGYPAETILGEPRRKTTRGMGGICKIKLLADKFASVTDPKSGKAEKITHRAPDALRAVEADPQHGRSQRLLGLLRGIAGDPHFESPHGRGAGGQLASMARAQLQRLGRR